MSDKRRKILIVDDSEIVRDMVSLMLEEQGFQVFTLDTAFGVTSALSQYRPDLVLMDVTMPALHGDKAAEIVLKNEMGRCPIVLHSDRSDGELAELVKKSGARGYIRKTSDARALARAIHGFLR